MKVRELLAKEKNWIKGRRAANATGAPTASNSPDAVSFCLLGAIERCYSNSAGVKATVADALQAKKEQALLGLDVTKLQELEAKNRNNFVISTFNDADTTKHSNVIDLLKELDL